MAESTFDYTVTIKKTIVFHLIVLVAKLKKRLLLKPFDGATIVKYTFLGKTERVRFNHKDVKW